MYIAQKGCFLEKRQVSVFRSEACVSENEQEPFSKTAYIAQKRIFSSWHRLGIMYYSNNFVKLLNTLTMIPTFNNTLQYLLIDKENAHIALSKASKKLNEEPVYKSSTFRTVGDMERGKFRRLFNRHKVAYRY